MASAYPDDAAPDGPVGAGTRATPAGGGSPPARRADTPDRRLRLDDILKLMVADGLILSADADRIGRSRTQRFEHPLELIAEQKLKSLKPPHRMLLLDPLVEWLAGKLGIPYRHIDPLKVDLGAVTATMSNAYAERYRILTFDGADLQYHVALNKQTGATVWKTNRSVAWNDENIPGQMARDGDLRKAHSTPLIVTAAGKPQMLSAGAKAAYAYDPRTGRELWRVQYPDYSTAPRPLFDGNLAFFVTGLSKNEMWAVKTDGEGDVTDSKVVWKLKTHIGKYASPLLVDGLIYTAADESFVTCLEAATGKVVWTERIGGKYAASPIYADGRLYFFSQDGSTTVLKPGRALEVLATNSLANGFMASPAVDGKAFYLRTKTHLYRIEGKDGES